MASYPSGKGEVCKTFMQRFDSARRLYEKDVRAGILFVIPDPPWQSRGLFKYKGASAPVFYGRRRGTQSKIVLTAAARSRSSANTSVVSVPSRRITDRLVL